MGGVTTLEKSLSYPHLMGFIFISAPPLVCLHLAHPCSFPVAAVAALHTLTLMQLLCQNDINKVSEPQN